MPGPERLHRRLLGGESCGKVRRRIAPPVRVRDFARRKDTLEETIAEALDRLSYAINLGSVEANTNDMHLGMLPQPGEVFEWTQEMWGPALRCRALFVPHLFTTRTLALRGARHEVARAWGKVAETLGVAPERLQQLRQVHGARAVEVSSETLRDSSQPWPEADVAVSVDPAVGLGIRVADCVPLLLFDPRTRAVAAAHAGWRGIAAGAPMAAVSALGQCYQARPSDLLAAAGPSIGPCCYSVGSELPRHFALHPEAASWFLRGRPLRLDLWRATRDQLRRAGLEDANIHLSRLCTACHVDVFCSYRKEGETTGRLAAVIKSARSQLS